MGGMGRWIHDSFLHSTHVNQALFLLLGMQDAKVVASVDPCQCQCSLLLTAVIENKEAAGMVSVSFIECWVSDMEEKWKHKFNYEAVKKQRNVQNCSRQSGKC